MAQPRPKPRSCSTACRVHATFLKRGSGRQEHQRELWRAASRSCGQSGREQEGQFDLGVTFDGDADRALFSDADGRVVNGDAVLLLVARDLQSRGVLPESTIVATTMSNMGLEIALRKSGIRMLRANVGDKYVLEEMLKTGAILGGEQSGHIIFRDGEATTGDGLLTALRVMEIMARTGKPLADLVDDLKVFPQTIQNVRVREKVPFAKVPAIQRAIESAERELDGNGRVVVRYSGTEAAGASDGGSGIGREDADAGRRHCGRDSTGAGNMTKLLFNAAAMWNLILLLVAIAVLGWFLYWFVLRRLIRARKIAGRPRTEDAAGSSGTAIKRG